jgi:23S rRNA pseudouridine955/2504/2580 synthase
VLQYQTFQYEYDVDMRLDRWLRRTYGDLTQGVIEKAIRERFVRVNALKSRAQTKLLPGDTIAVEVHLHEKWMLSREEAKAEQAKRGVAGAGAGADTGKSDFSPMILQETEDFIVLNKLAGVDVQGGWNVKESIDTWLKSVSDQYRLVHRLDRDTSGALLVAKNLRAAIFFTKLFKERKIQKIYRAIILGTITPSQGRICAPIAEVKAGESLMKVDSIRGKKAETSYRVIFHNRQNNWSDIELEPHTGRKHQLRVHLAFSGNPIVGDVKYDTEKKTFYLLPRTVKKAMFLHAYKITFKDFKGKLITITAPLPQYWPSY